MCRVILSDSELQIEARMLCLAFGPTHKAYCSTMKKQKTQLGCAQLEAAMACGDWCFEVRDIAKLTADETVLAKLDITQSSQLLDRPLNNEVLEALFYIERWRAKTGRTTNGLQSGRCRARAPLLTSIACG